MLGLNLYKRVLLVFLFVLLSQCITEFDPRLTDQNPKLVVDGLITNQPGPYSVRLSYSSAYNNKPILGFFPFQAQVYIKDDTGAEELLRYTSNGYFKSETNGIRGVAGRQYWVSIILPDGTEYESAHELLNPVPQIDTIYSIYQELNAGFMRGKFEIFLDTSDPPDEINYYRWSWSHYESKTVCDITYDFPPLTKVSWGCCVPCWSFIKCEGCINIGSDRLINGKKISRQYLLDVSYNSVDPYYLLIEQQSLTKNGYEFWEKVRSQVTNSGGVFDTPPIAIKGNVTNVNNPDEKVLGYFGASSVYYKYFYVNRLSVGKPPYGQQVGPPPILRSCKPCIEEFSVTAKRPPGWKD